MKVANDALTFIKVPYTQVFENPDSGRALQSLKKRSGATKFVWASSAQVRDIRGSGNDVQWNKSLMIFLGNSL